MVISSKRGMRLVFMEGRPKAGSVERLARLGEGSIPETCECLH